MLKKRVVAAVAAALMAGGVSAVQVNPGDKGEVLLAPMVMVGGSWESELRLINTNTTDSVVAKVAFHAAGRSEEVLDFYVFLSPGDVWRGTAVKNPDGKFGIKSSDDSSLVVEVPNLTSGASCPLPVARSVGFDPLVMNSTVPQDFTYVKVFQSRVIKGLGAAPVAKAAILSAFSKACTDGAPVAVNNDLTGDVTLSNALNGNVLRLPMTALQDYRNGADQFLGRASTFAFPSANTTATKAQVEDALWASNFVIPYNVSNGNFTYATVTFPTKETFINAAASQYFPANRATQTPQIGIDVRNEAEQTLTPPPSLTCIKSPCDEVPLTPANSLANELNVIQVASGAGTSSSSVIRTENFTRGWVNLRISPIASTSASSVNYNNQGDLGAPALVTVIDWSVSGNGLQGSWKYAPKSQNPN